MERPTHMYFTRGAGNNVLIAHYGRLRAVTEVIFDDFGLAEVLPFRHPKRGHVQCFKEMQEPEEYPLNGVPERKIRDEVSRLAARNGIKAIELESIYDFGDLFFTEVNEEKSWTARRPAGLYARNLETCIGISLYNKENGHAHMFHAPGHEYGMMPAILKHLDRRLKENWSDPKRVEVNVASGLVTLGDDKKLETIGKIRKGLISFFHSNGIEPLNHFCEREEYVSFMSINSNNGRTEVIKNPWVY